MSYEKELTLEQIDLLKRISINDDKIDLGDLAEWQEEILRQYDFGKAYLNEKYPSHYFVIMDADGTRHTSPFSRFWFVADDGVGEQDAKAYELHIFTDENNQTQPYRAEDNFFGVVISSQMENDIKEILKNNDLPCEQVQLAFGAAEGPLFHEKVLPLDVLTGKLQTSVGIGFCFLEDQISKDYDALNRRIQKIVEENGWRGNFLVKVLEGGVTGRRVFSASFQRA